MRNKISRETYNRLNRQLLSLQKEMLDVTLPEIERAREFSNNEENDEMMHAQADQRKYENRIAEIDQLIKGSDVIDEIEFTGAVDFGTDVHIQNVDDGSTRWIRIVGEMEGQNRSEICFKSPVGQALLGHVPGDEVEIHTPGGVQNWEILDVRVSSVFTRVQGRE